MELIVVLMILTLLFGAKKLPELGAAIGKGIRNFKDSMTQKENENEDLVKRDSNDTKS
jgi:sec-independent protein translocase protein TatA